MKPVTNQSKFYAAYDNLSETFLNLSNLHEEPTPEIKVLLAEVQESLLQSLDKLKRCVVIPAKANSEDHMMRVEFNAAPFFMYSSDKELQALIDNGWGGNGAKNVAVYMKPHVPQLEQMFHYLQTLEGTRREHDFECYVDESSAICWLEQFRPDMLEKGVPEDDEIPHCEVCRELDTLKQVKAVQVQIKNQSGTGSYTETVDFTDFDSFKSRYDSMLSVAGFSEYTVSLTPYWEATEEDRKQFNSITEGTYPLQ